MPAFLINALLWLIAAGATLAGVAAAAWAAGALYYDLPVSGTVRTGLAIVWAVGCLVAMVTAWYRQLRRRGNTVTVAVAAKATATGTATAAARDVAKVILVPVIIFLCILGWWLTQEPRQDRDWKEPLAVLPYADVNVNAGVDVNAGGGISTNSDTVTIHNVRNFDYRTEHDYTPRYETRTCHLSQLRGIDVFQTYWGSPYMAHPIFSFDFGPEGRIAFSIETRQEKREGYSAIGGIYRQYEIITVVADERDVIRLRTNIRPGEDVYLYRLLITPEAARTQFMGYIATVNSLKARPEWYNALGHNCTTVIRTQQDVSLRMAWDYRILVNGYADEMLYGRGMLDQSLPFKELKERAYINKRAQAAGNAPDFSERIRTHLPVRSPAPGSAPTPALEPTR